MNKNKSQLPVVSNDIALEFSSEGLKSSEVLPEVAAAEVGRPVREEVAKWMVPGEAADLSPAQMKAIEMLVSGHSVMEAVRAAGVGRTTLYRWLKGDAAFGAVYNQWQQGVIDTARGRLLSLSHLAVTAVEKSLEKADVKTAMKLLEKLGVLDRAETGPTDPAMVERKIKMERRRASSRMDKAETEAMFPW